VTPSDSIKINGYSFGKDMGFLGKHFLIWFQ
jgi:hypothetical protein